jgi:hypothetical protein
LQKGIPVDRAVKESLEAQIPKEVFVKFFTEEILGVIDCKVVHNALKFFWRIFSKCLFKRTMEQHPIIHEGFYNRGENFAIFFSKSAVLEFRVGNGLTTDKLVFRFSLIFS